MTQIEYSDFYKFTVSVGIALIVLAAVVPWLFLREHFDLLVDSAQLAHLTPAAQAIVADRQLLVQRIFRYIPWISIATSLVGLFLAGFGLRQWWARQGVRDETEELGLAKLKMELTTMSPQQVTARLEADAEQLLGPTETRTELVASTKQIRDIEQELYKRISTCFRHSHFARANQRLGNAEYDIILESNEKKDSDILIEVKYIRRGFQSGWMRESVGRLMLANDLYMERLKRKSSPLLLIVTAEAVEISTSQFADMRRKLPQVMDTKCRVERLRESELATISCDTLESVIFGNS
jgi:hypothetical protein